MAKTTIIGAGFSAWAASLFCPPDTQIIGATASPVTPNSLIRRKNLELNKFFSRNTRSHGSLLLKNFSGRLHDRLGAGGNSAIWGGFCNEANLPARLLLRMQQQGVLVKPLSFGSTGSKSNISSIGQLQDEKQRILNVAHFLPNTFMPGYVLSVIPIGVNSEIIFIPTDNFIQAHEHKLSIQTKRTVFALGPVQMLDLMYRSGWLKDGDHISLSEFNNSFNISFTRKPEIFTPSKDTIIRYQVLRAALHMLGHQKSILSDSPSNSIGIYIDQKFDHSKKELCLQLKENLLNEVLPTKTSSKRENSFGASIHYCNLKINGESINTFLQKINPNFIGLGMGFVNQQVPGPISNDILLDAFQKLS